MSVINPESGIDKKVSTVAIFLRWGEASRKCMNKGCIDVRVPQSYYIKKKEVLIVLSFVGFLEDSPRACLAVPLHYLRADL